MKKLVDDVQDPLWITSLLMAPYRLEVQAEWDFTDEITHVRPVR